jgi:hypothetical protein
MVAGPLHQIEVEAALACIVWKPSSVAWSTELFVQWDIRNGAGHLRRWAVFLASLVRRSQCFDDQADRDQALSSVTRDREGA